MLNLFDAGFLIPVLFALRFFGLLNHPVDQLISPAIDVVLDGVDDQGALTNRIADVQNRAAGFDRRHYGDAAIQRQAGKVTTLRGREQLTAHHGANAVNANHHVGPYLLRGRRVQAVIKRDGYPMIVLAEAQAATAEGDGIGTQTLLNGTVEHHLQMTAMYEALVMFIAHVTAALFGENLLAVAGIKNRFLRFDGDLAEGVVQTEFGQLFHRVRFDIYPDAKRLNFLNGFE